MKRLSFLLVAFALVTFVSMNSCKSSTQPEAEATETEVVEEAVEEVADTVAVEAEEVMEEAVEEAAE